MSTRYGTRLRIVYGPRAWREGSYAFMCLPSAVAGLAAALATVFLGVLTAVVFIGLPVLSLLLAADRGLAHAQRRLAAALLRVPIAKPARARRPPGVRAFLAYSVADPVAWRAVGCFVVRIPFGAAQFVLGFVPLCAGVVLTFYPLLTQLVSSDDAERRRGDLSYGFQLGHFRLDSWPLGVLACGAGLLVLAAAPWLTHAVLGLDRWLLPRLLGPAESSMRIRELEATRQDAINQAAATLRRIERDLHDGAQAQLVALGMRLARAERQLDHADVTRARELVRASRDEVTTMIIDLRDLVRGIHPPALDAGLHRALATLAARAAIPTTVQVELPSRPPAAVETTLYFAVAELLTNAGKHSRATACAIEIVEDGDTLRLTASDDGIGGATQAGAGSGLRGLAERVRTLGGTLTLTSPPGGPTIITVDLPRRGTRRMRADTCGS
jgi:signal transduction histidine kinase